jgi:MFS transporter, ACS family, tartrate transporter
MATRPGTASISIEETTIRKLRIRLLPFLLLLYIVAFVDRINIGFAALTMNKELALTSQQFGFAAGVFFFGYFFFEVPSNLLLHRIGARVWIARILISWGVLATLTGFVNNVHQLYAARFLLGLAEAGYFPGIVLYLTYWFRQREQAQSIALFMAGIPIASIVGSPISGFILDQVHWLHTSSWRWLLILEGIPAVLCGLLTYFVLPSRPAEAKFLTNKEKEWLAQELAHEERQKQRGSNLSAIQALFNGRVWHLASIGFAHGVGTYTMSFWLPQLMKSLLRGQSNTVIGSVLMVPYSAGLVGMILVSRHSDRMLERRYHVATSAFVAGIALITFGSVHSTFLSIVLLSMATLGIFSILPPYFSMPGEFLTGVSAASGIALITSIANLGGFVGPYIVGLIRQRTGSLYAGLAFAGISLFVSATLTLLLRTRTRSFACKPGSVATETNP